MVWGSLPDPGQLACPHRSGMEGGAVYAVCI